MDNAIANTDILITFPQDAQITQIKLPNGPFKCSTTIDMISQNGNTIKWEIKLLTEGDCSKLASFIRKPAENAHEYNWGDE